MRTISVSVYQPATPLRAVAVYFDGEQELQWELPVVGIELRVVQFPGEEDVEARHQVLVLEDGMVHSLQDYREEHSNYCDVILGVASMPSQWWEEQAAEVIKRRQLPESLTRIAPPMAFSTRPTP